MNKTKQEITDLIKKFIESFGEGEKITDYDEVFYNKNKTIGINVASFLEDFAEDILFHQTENSNVEGDEERDAILLKHSELLYPPKYEWGNGSDLNGSRRYDFIDSVQSDAARQYHSSKKEVDLENLKQFTLKFQEFCRIGSYGLNPVKSYDEYLLSFYGRTILKKILKPYLQSDNSEVERLKKVNKKVVEEMRFWHDAFAEIDSTKTLVERIDLLEKQLSEQKGSDAVEFAEWTNDLDKCSYYPEYNKVKNTLEKWVNRNDYSDTLNTNELYNTYLKSKN